MKFDIRYFEEVTSTNTVLKERAEQGAPEGLVIVAHHQTAGRGKLDRKWLSSAGTNLLFSLLIRPKIDTAHAPLLTQIACRAVARVLGFHYGIACHFKSPNDILVDGKKICGILCESAAHGQTLDYAIIGIGLNVHESPQELGGDAISMQDILKKQIALNQLLDLILKQLDQDLKSLKTN